MATLNLGSYTLKAGASSVIGYSTKLSANNGYSLWENKSAEGFGDSTTVGKITVGSAGAAHQVSLGGTGFEKGNLTEITTGSSSDAWSIVGDDAKYATVTKITTGAGNDVVSMDAMNTNATVSTGAGNDSVSIGTANGTMTVELGDGSDVLFLNSANGSLTVRAGDGANAVSIHSAASTLSYTGGEGVDSVIIDKVDKDADINAGNGANEISVGAAGGALNITTGDGADSISVKTAEGAVVISAGDGNNHVTVEDAKKSLTVSTGSGKDSVSIGSVAGDATISLGDGADSLEIAGKVEGTLVISGDGDSANLVSVHSSAIDKGVSISFGSGADSLIIDNTTVGGTINLGDGKDQLSLKAVEKATINGGSGDKVVSLGTVTEGSLSLGNGKDSVVIDKLDSSTVDLGDGRDVILVKSAIGSTINLGAENDSIKIGGASTKFDSSTINLGDGKDTIIIDSNTKVSEATIAGGAGADVFSVKSDMVGTVTISDFEVGTDTLYGGVTFDHTMFTNEGQVSLSGNAKVQMAGSGSYAVTYNDGNATYNVAWTGENGTTLDASSFTKAAVLIGDNNEDASDTLLGGTKSDSIYAGANDYVYGGAGNDSITVTSSTDDTTYVGFTKNGGKDVVSDFSSSDVVYLFENSISDISKVTYTSASDVTLKLGTATLNLTSTKDITKFGVRDSSGSDYTLQVVTGSTSVDNVDNMANIYYAADGTKGGLNFSNVNDKLVVDLGNTGLYTNTNNAQYLGKYASVKGGSDDTILMGAADQGESLIAGTGATTIWGGGSKTDTMIHEGSDNSVMFVFGQGDGKDTISSNNWGASDTNDVLWLNGGTLSSIKNNGTDTTIALTSGDKVTLSKATDANTVIKYTTDAGATVSQAKIGVSGRSNNFNYTEGVSAYIGGSDNTLTVGSDVDTANIWLDGSQNVSYEGVKVVDAHSSSGDLVIAGTGSKNESLLAGKGNTSMWGGAGSSNDTLSGTTGGTTTYFWGNGDGKDVITGSHSDDVVNLYNVALSDIAENGIKTTSTSMEITLNDGSSLTINNMSSSSVKTFQLSDGSKWEYSTSTKEWSQA